MTSTAGPGRHNPGIIDSPQNRTVAAARALLTRKGRVASSSFLVEGPHAVGEVLSADGFVVRELFVTPGGAEREVELLRTAAAARVVVRTVTDRVLAALSDTVTPQGVVAVVETPSATPADVLTAETRLAVLLERIADPGNAGAVIRTADAAGADAVLASTGSVDLWSGKCIRATAGSAFHLPVLSDVDLLRAAEVAAASGVQILATAGDGADDLFEVMAAGDLGAPTLWVFGNEAQGISGAARAAADRVVRVPVYGSAESLNLAAAAAVCLYASARSQNSFIPTSRGNDSFKGDEQSSPRNVGPHPTSSGRDGLTGPVNDYRPVD